MFKKMNLSGIVLGVFVIGVALKMYLESDAFNLKCIVSNVDGNKYCVRERAKLQLAADLLANTTQKLKKLVICVIQSSLSFAFGKGTSPASTIFAISQGFIP